MKVESNLSLFLSNNLSVRFSLVCIVIHSTSHRANIVFCKSFFSFNMGRVLLVGRSILMYVDKESTHAHQYFTFDFTVDTYT